MAPTYKIIGVAKGRVVESTQRGAPTEADLCAFGHHHRCAAVVRYFPSKQGWRVLDIRAAEHRHPTRNGRYLRPNWVGQVRSRFYPTEDAAVMVAIHMIGCT